MKYTGHLYKYEKRAEAEKMAHWLAEREIVETGRAER